MKTLPRFVLLLGAVITFMLTFSSYLSSSHVTNLNTDTEQLPAATGKVYIAEKIRTYKEENENSKSTERQHIKKLDKNEKIDKKVCEKWGVMTTISSMSESVKRFLYKLDWCIAVVGDLEKPEVRTYRSLRRKINLFLKKKKIVLYLK